MTNYSPSSSPSPSGEPQDNIISRILRGIVNLFSGNDDSPSPSSPPTEVIPTEGIPEVKPTSPPPNTK